MAWIWLPVFIFLSVSIFLFSISVDFRSIYMSVRKGAKATSIVIDRTIYTGKQSRFGKFLKTTDEMILNSNIKVLLPFYNVFIHITFCCFVAVMAFLWISSHINLLIALMFFVLAFIIPYAVLQLIADFMNERVRKYSVDFLNILRNYFMATGDIFVALDKSKEYFIEPLHTYVDVMIFEYKNKVSPVNCINNIIKKIRYGELKLFFENLKIAYIQGSDILLLMDEFINEIGNINDDSDKEDTQDKVLNSGLYLLLLLNFLVVFYMINSQYRAEIINSFMGQSAFAADILISIYIVYMTIKKKD